MIQDRSRLSRMSGRNKKRNAVAKTDINPTFAVTLFFVEAIRKEIVPLFLLKKGRPVGKF
jgi:hypothetical protein